MWNVAGQGSHWEQGEFDRADDHEASTYIRKLHEPLSSPRLSRSCTVPGLKWVWSVQYVDFKNCKDREGAIFKYELFSKMLYSVWLNLWRKKKTMIVFVFEPWPVSRQVWTQRRSCSVETGSSHQVTFYNFESFFSSPLAPFFFL